MFSSGSRRLVSRLVLTRPTLSPPSTTIKSKYQFGGGETGVVRLDMCTRCARYAQERGTHQWRGGGGETRNSKGMEDSEEILEYKPHALMPPPAPRPRQPTALPAVSSRPHSTATEVLPPLSVVPTLASRSADAASKKEALTAWRTRGLIVDAGNNPHKLLGLLEKGSMDANNMVILVTRLAQACEGKEEVKTAVQADARFAQLVARVVGGVEGAVEEKLSELQVSSLREGLRVFGIEGV